MSDKLQLAVIDDAALCAAASPRESSRATTSSSALANTPLSADTAGRGRSNKRKCSEPEPIRRVRSSSTATELTFDPALQPTHESALTTRSLSSLDREAVLSSPAPPLQGSPPEVIADTQTTSAAPSAEATPTLLVLGCRPTLDNVENEVKAVSDAVPNSMLLLDPTAEAAAYEAPHHVFCHFAGHADPKLDQRRVLIWCDGSGGKGLAAVDAETLVGMLRTMKLVVLNGCKSHELGAALIKAGVMNVVVWTTKVRDEVAYRFGVRFWEVMRDRIADSDLKLYDVVRNAFDHAKVAVQTPVQPGGAVDTGTVGLPKYYDVSVPTHELHDPEDPSCVEDVCPYTEKPTDIKRLPPEAGPDKAGRIAAGVPWLMQRLPPETDRALRRVLPQHHSHELCSITHTRLIISPLPVARRQLQPPATAQVAAEAA